MNLFKRVLASVAVSAMLVVPASALTLTFDEYSQSSKRVPTGASGEVELVFSDLRGVARVDAKVKNTTGSSTFGLGATLARLTGFGFDLLTGVKFAGNLTTGAFLDTTIHNAAFWPFGSLDLAFADNNNFMGGWPGFALPEGQSDTFSFALTLGSYGSARGLENAFFDGFVNGELDAGLRFQRVNTRVRGDKLIGPQVSAVPLPATGILLIAGMGALAVARRRQKPA